MKKLIHYLMPLLAALLASGCGSILPSKRTQDQAVKTSEAIAANHDLMIEKALEGERPSPQPVPTQSPVHVGGLGNKVDVKIEAPREPVRNPQMTQISADGEERTLPGIPYRSRVLVKSSGGQKAGSNEAAAGNATTTVPMWVNLAGFGVALLIVLYAVTMWRKSSVAVDAAYKAGDAAAGNIISHLKTQAMATTDPTKSSELNAHIAMAEAERGKLAAS